MCTKRIDTPAWRLWKAGPCRPRIYLFIDPYILLGGYQKPVTVRGIAFIPPNSRHLQSTPLCQSWTCCLPEQSVAQASSPRLLQTWASAWEKSHLTCAGFSLLTVQAHGLQVLPADTNIWSDDTCTGKVPHNTNGLGILAYKSEELVTCLFPPEISRLATWGSDCQSMERSLHCHPVWSASHRRLMCLGKRQKAVSELLVFWVTTGSSKTGHPNSHWCLLLTVGFSQPEEQKMLPWKRSQNSVPIPSTLEFLAFGHAICTKQIGVEFIWLNAYSYICRSSQ